MIRMKMTKSGFLESWRLNMQSRPQNITYKIWKESRTIRGLRKAGPV
jgi:hypothetical protein